MRCLSRKRRRVKKIRQKISKFFLPRLSIFRSNSHIYLQLISVVDNGRVLLTSSSVEEIVKKEFLLSKKNKIDVASFVGNLFVKRFRECNFGKFVFDRSGYRFHGRVKAAVVALREGGLIF